MAILAGNLLFLGVLFSLTALLLWAGYYGKKVRRGMRERRH